MGGFIRQALQRSAGLRHALCFRVCRAEVLAQQGNGGILLGQCFIASPQGGQRSSAGFHHLSVFAVEIRAAG